MLESTRLLQEACIYSLSFEEEVVKGINVDVTGRRSRCEKTRPLPVNDLHYNVILITKEKNRIHMTRTYHR